MSSKIVKQWFKFAARDLKLAKFSLDFSSAFKNESAFHSQQCVEKVIKGYLAFKRIRFPKTHEIEVLIQEVDKIDPLLARGLKKGSSLSIYAVIYRYPDAERKALTVKRARSAIKVAETIFKKCQKQVYGKN